MVSKDTQNIVKIIKKTPQPRCCYSEQQLMCYGIKRCHLNILLVGSYNTQGNGGRILAPVHTKCILWYEEYKK